MLIRSPPYKPSCVAETAVIDITDGDLTCEPWAYCTPDQIPLLMPSASPRHPAIPKAPSLHVFAPERCSVGLLVCIENRGLAYVVEDAALLASDLDHHAPTRLVKKFGPL